MTHLPPANVTYLVGGAETVALPRVPFDALACQFLTSLSTSLRTHNRGQDFPDILTFAFWCRTGNINKLKLQHDDGVPRLGRGLTFHIAPSNVPVNFAYSFVFALLSGNSSIVRVPSRDMVQVDIICDEIKALLNNPTFEPLRKTMAFVRYPHDEAVTAAFSAKCDARIIWGGDDTVAEIRKLPTPPRAVELAFPDRYSFCIMSPTAIIALSNDLLMRLAEGFYNDTYLMDQNACSSPHLVVWHGGSAAVVTQAKERFWQAVQSVVAERYKLQAVHMVDKYTTLLGKAAANDGQAGVKLYGNEVYTLSMNTLPPSLDDYRGKFGLFYEYATAELAPLAPLVTAKFQTLTYFGVPKEELRDFVVTNHLSGIDRIVPVGQALDIDIIWDGHDIIRYLSRIVDVR